MELRDWELLQVSKAADLIHIEASTDDTDRDSEIWIAVTFFVFFQMKPGGKNQLKARKPHNSLEQMATSTPMKIAVHQISGKVTVLEVMPETTVRDAQLELAGR